MYYIQWLLLIILFSAVTSCASPQMAQNFQLGKAEYTAGNYKRAFRQLLPIAVAGNPVAQYAVGYMYYYGFGVPADCESGLFWMRCSAQRGYVPAIKALQMIQKNEMQPPRSLPTRRVQIEETHEEVMRAPRPLPRTYTTAPIIRAEPEKPIISTPPPPPLSAKKPPMSSKPYAFQLFGAYDLDSVKEVQQGLKFPTRVYQTQHNGKDWFVLTTGKYQWMAEASQAKRALPPEVKSFNPWVRNVSGLLVV